MIVANELKSLLTKRIEIRQKLQSNNLTPQERSKLEEDYHLTKVFILAKAHSKSWDSIVH